jgi:hypothetical protein
MDTNTFIEYIADWAAFHSYEHLLGGSLFQLNDLDNNSNFHRRYQLRLQFFHARKFLASISTSDNDALSNLRVAMEQVICAIDANDTRLPSFIGQIEVFIRKCREPQFQSSIADLKKSLLDELVDWEKQLLPLPVLNGSIFEGVNDASSQYLDASSKVLNVLKFEKINDNDASSQSKKVPKAKRKPWTQAEEDALKRGYDKYKKEKNCYSKIKGDAAFMTILEARDNVALKDKTRSLGLVRK